MMLRGIEIALFIVGLVLLGVFGYSWAERNFYQWQGEESLDRALSQERTPAGQVPDASSPQPSAPNSPEKPPAKGVPLGRIEIPRLGIRAIVEEGIGPRDLRVGVGHIPGTALPGQPGNAAFAAHRDTYFRDLRDIRHGDRIRVTTLDGTHSYEVSSIVIVEPSESSVLKPTASPTITLVTCYPFNYVGAAPHRFVVQAREVDAPPVAERDKQNRTHKPLIAKSPRSHVVLRHRTPVSFLRPIAARRTNPKQRFHKDPARKRRVY